MLDIVQYLPTKRKASPSGWISFDAPCCHHNGNSRDQRQRGGIKTNEQGWSYHCFNCGYTASFILGRVLSFKARRLLSWVGVPDREIDLANLESLRHRSIYGIVEDRQRVANILQGIDFEERDLPATIDVTAVYAKVLERVFALSPKTLANAGVLEHKTSPLLNGLLGV
jgi:hypothetical protein